MRVSRTVTSSLPGHRLEARRQGMGQQRGEPERQQRQRTQQHRQQGQQARCEPLRGGPPFGGERARIGRHEGGRERALREKVPQQVRDAERDLEGVGVQSGAQQPGEDLLPDEAEQARNEGERRYEAGGAHECAPQALGAAVLDLVAQGP